MKNVTYAVFEILVHLTLWALLPLMISLVKTYLFVGTLSAIVIALLIVYAVGVRAWWSIYPMNTHDSTFIVPVLAWPLMLPLIFVGYMHLIYCKVFR